MPSSGRSCSPRAASLWLGVPTFRGHPGGRGARTEPHTGEQVIAVPVGTSLEDVEKLLIAETLRHTGGNKAQAASLLGISARTIYRKQAPGDSEIE